MKPSLLRILYLSLVILLISAYSAQATHLRAGEITVRRDACNSLKFWITITVFTNTINTNVLFGGEDDILDFGDGGDPDRDGRPGILVPETQNTLRPDLGEGIATASFTYEYTYRGNGTYIISYSEPNRNAGVVNMDGSVNTRFYIETKIITDPFYGCNENTPVLGVPPIDRGCTGVAWFHNPGAYDLDGDSLSYEMVIPFRARQTTVVNYRDPNNPKFYSNFNTGNEQKNGAPTFNINPVDGTITWDAPGAAGEYNIAFIIKEWRFVEGRWRELGFVRRDMQIIIEDCDNERPDLIVPEDICVEAGTTIDETILGIDPDNDNVRIEAFSEIFNFTENAATYSPKPATFQPSLPPAQLKFHWQTTCAHVKSQPYQVVLKITDKSPTGSSLVTFKTWLIRVVGPPPQWVNAGLVANQSAALQWDNYFCNNAESMQIWRRVDSNPFEPDTCQTGMPPNLGYTLVDVIQMRDANNNPVTSYTDTNNGKGLAPGAKYCYRLVAIFPEPKGGESYVSSEVCLDQVPITAPVITNVSVQETSTTSGKIEVKWIAPKDAPGGPFTYEVFRAEGFTGNADIVSVATTTGLTFIDQNINTENRIYNYRILARDNNGALVDTSAVASTVRLEAQSQLNRIQLTWSADVPWSNQVPGLKHRIYRGEEGATLPGDLQLITELDVLTTGLIYTDEGQHNGVPLDRGTTYCYVVETVGSYGSTDPDLQGPFFNFSQIICTRPGDENPPCKPATPLAHEPVNCDDYVGRLETCNNSISISNTIKWSRPAGDCDDDISFYRVYVSPTSNGIFVPLVDRTGNFLQVRDTFYVHQNLPSFAGCYKISAVDRSGNEGELSDAICFDNCPYYELPNVFTPNNDFCNDVFSAYSERDIVGENASSCGNPSDQSKARCARFVRKVVFRVYNRWGKEVYNYESGGERTIYIDWDGRSSEGRELASGVYYYVADVTFDTANPAKRDQVIKGWVNLIREAP
ncbi:gliding motility-associated C-terminal domain-containing protein [Chryseosolibacter indicus]|uniref:Gliding motility-associated C-terminal domain-containing protein n=1 Tax=Chryseosolibacter indicus TaxID=2782351 RepID=A0ABS5VMS8_9BACT|nr:gliding motility-associated C-terminal domain-containing protein [Chryseosolibacter indicus]MBT1702323.1 gliding motility-associated C-terminal domain-containing protein [Chryseosolibacter indicus]